MKSNFTAEGAFNRSDDIALNITFNFFTFFFSNALLRLNTTSAFSISEPNGKILSNAVPFLLIMPAYSRRTELNSKTANMKITN